MRRSGKPHGAGALLRRVRAGDRNALGFTLLEVLVALAIASLALTALFAAGGTGLFATDAATRAEEALERARSHLAAAGREAVLAPTDAAGDDGGGYRWQLRVRPLESRRTPAGNGLFGPLVTATLYEIDVAVSWRQGGRERRVELRTLRLATTAGTP